MTIPADSSTAAFIYTDMIAFLNQQKTTCQKYKNHGSFEVYGPHPTLIHQSLNKNGWNGKVISEREPSLSLFVLLLHFSFSLIPSFSIRGPYTHFHHRVQDFSEDLRNHLNQSPPKSLLQFSQLVAERIIAQMLISSFPAEGCQHTEIQKMASGIKSK